MLGSLLHLEQLHVFPLNVAVRLLQLLLQPPGLLLPRRDVSLFRQQGLLGQLRLALLKRARTAVTGLVQLRRDHQKGEQSICTPKQQYFSHIMDVETRDQCSLNS